MNWTHYNTQQYKIKTKSTPRNNTQRLFSSEDVRGFNNYTVLLSADNIYYNYCWRSALPPGLLSCGSHTRKEIFFKYRLYIYNFCNICTTIIIITQTDQLIWNVAFGMWYSSRGNKPIVIKLLQESPTNTSWLLIHSDNNNCFFRIYIRSYSANSLII